MADKPKALFMTLLNHKSERVGDDGMIDMDGCGAKDTLLFNVCES